MVVKKKDTKGPLTRLNDSIKVKFAAEIAGAKGNPPHGEKWRKGDQVMYRGAPWFVSKDDGGAFVSIRDSEDEDPDEKHVYQKVPRDTLFAMGPSAGNGPPKSEAEENFKKFQKKQTERRQMFTDAELTAPPSRKRKRGEPSGTREVKPKDPNAIPLKKICAEVNVDPKLARRLLRAETSIPRPEGRWEFNPKDVERIKKVITKPI